MKLIQKITVQKEKIDVPPFMLGILHMQDEQFFYEKHEECRWDKNTIRSEMTTDVIREAIEFMENPQ